MSKPVVIVADDDPSLLEALGIRLRAAGFEVHAAQDGYMAVQLARRVRPDAMLLDIGMPAGDGFSVQDRVMQCHSIDPPQFVYLTGSRSAEAGWSSREHKPFALLRKPYSGQGVVAVVKGAVRRAAEVRRATAERAAREAAILGHAA